MRKIAIIPARGGSKRIPNKNIKDFLGKPIIAYSIEAALESELFDEVMVSTESEEIAEVSRRYGAKVPFLRSKKNSDDYATTVDVLLEVLENYYSNKGEKFEYCCCIYPTAPLIKIGHLKQGYRKIKSLNLNTVFPVVSFSYPIWRGLEIDIEGKVKMLWPEYLDSRSQDLMQVYHDTGQWYWLKVEGLKSIFTEQTGSVVLSEDEVQDIDTFSDWKLAEMKYKLLDEKA